MAKNRKPSVKPVDVHQVQIDLTNLLTTVWIDELESSLCDTFCIMRTGIEDPDSSAIMDDPQRTETVIKKLIADNPDKYPHYPIPGTQDRINEGYGKYTEPQKRKFFGWFDPEQQELLEMLLGVKGIDDIVKYGDPFLALYAEDPEFADAYEAMMTEEPASSFRSLLGRRVVSTLAPADQPVSAPASDPASTLAPADQPSVPEPTALSALDSWYNNLLLVRVARSLKAALRASEPSTEQTVIRVCFWLGVTSVAINAFQFVVAIILK